MIRKLINLRINQLIIERRGFFEIQTYPGTFHHAKLCLAIEIWDFKIIILRAMI